MNATCSRSCADCPTSTKVVCRCLGVTEDQIITMVETLGLRTVKDVKVHTEAGTGCTCCHGEIRALLERHVPELAAAG